MNADFKIDKGVKITESPRDGKWMQLVAKMKIGESVLLPNKRMAACLYSSVKLRGFVGVVRKEKAGHRVWKMDKDYSRKRGRAV